MNYEKTERIFFLLFVWHNLLSIVYQSVFQFGNAGLLLPPEFGQESLAKYCAGLINEKKDFPFHPVSPNSSDDGGSLSGMTTERLSLRGMTSLDFNG